MHSDEFNNLFFMIEGIMWSHLSSRSIVSFWEFFGIMPAIYLIWNAISMMTIATFLGNFIANHFHWIVASNLGSTNCLWELRHSAFRLAFQFVTWEHDRVINTWNNMEQHGSDAARKTKSQQQRGSRKKRGDHEVSIFLYDLSFRS